MLPADTAEKNCSCGNSIVANKRKCKKYENKNQADLGKKMHKPMRFVHKLAKKIEINPFIDKRK